MAKVENYVTRHNSSVANIPFIQRIVVYICIPTSIVAPGFHTLIQVGDILSQLDFVRHSRDRLIKKSDMYSRKFVAMTCCTA